MTTAIYVRISNDREGRELGVQRQERLCRELAERLGVTAVEVFSDNDISASRRSTKPRPGYQRMLSEARAGRIGMVLAYSTSRLTRRPREIEDLIDLVEHHRLIIHTVSGQIDLSTAAGRTVAGILASIDAGEPDVISERVKAKKEQMRESGIYGGGQRPFGFEADGVTARVSEQNLIRSAAVDILAGRSLAGIARDWGKVVDPPTWHAPLVIRWRPNSVRGILIRERARGLLPDGRPAVWEPVLDEQTWLGVRAVLTDPARRNSRPGATVRLLTGIAECGKCTAPIGAAGRGQYRCSISRHIARQVEPVDDYVRDVLLEFLATNEISASAGSGRTSGDLAGRAAGIRARLAELEESAADPDGPSPRLLAAAERKLKAELADVEVQLAATAGTSALAGLPTDRTELAAIWEAADNERRRALLKAAPLKITVHPPGRGARVFDPATVTVERV